MSVYVRVHVCVAYVQWNVNIHIYLSSQVTVLLEYISLYFHLNSNIKLYSNLIQNTCSILHTAFWRVEVKLHNSI